MIRSNRTSRVRLLHRQPGIAFQLLFLVGVVWIGNLGTGVFVLRAPHSTVKKVSQFFGLEDSL